MANQVRVIQGKLLVYSSYFELDQHVVGPSGTGLRPLKHEIRCSIPDPCVWKRLGWEWRPHLQVASQILRQKLVISEAGGNYIPMTWYPKKKIELG